MIFFLQFLAILFPYKLCVRVEKILKGSLDLIPSPSRNPEHLIFLAKLCVVNKICTKLFVLTTPSNFLTLNLKPTFRPVIWIFTEDEGDGIESRLSSKIFFHFNTEKSIYVNKRRNLLNPCLLKVSRSRKQIIMSLILPKKWTKHPQDTILRVFRSFFGRIRDFIICFQDLLIFKGFVVNTL